MRDPARSLNATMDEASPEGKILRGTEGLGTVTPQLVEKRAREIARSDGREQPNDLDLTRAREELTGATSSSEKSATREEPGRDWGMPLVSSGEKAPTVRPEDEENIPEKLIQQGIDEADHDQRSSSAQNSERS
jgi:hypothetical protein